MPPDASHPERFLPFRCADVVHMCTADAEQAGGEAKGEQEREGFRRLADLLCAQIHFEFRARRERLKHLYAPLDPGADTRRLAEPSAEEERERAARFEEELVALLEAANFVQVTRADLAESLGNAALFQVRLEVDLDDFEVLRIFRRGSSRRVESVPRLPFGLLPRDVEFVNYDRVAFYGRFQDAAYFEARGREDLAFEPGSTILKLFKNIPRADLEMLLPNSQVRMRTVDKLLIGVPAILGGMTVLTSKLLSALGASLLLIAFWLGLREQEVELDEAATVALFGGLMALGAHSFRQYDKFKNRRIRFLKTLTENLYYKTIDNDAGVFHHLLDVAEESEAKETLLAYRCLLRAKVPLAKEELDGRIEAWLRERWKAHVDFDVEDALHKLHVFGLATENGGRWRCLELEAALERLANRWDELFAGEADPATAARPRAARRNA